MAGECCQVAQLYPSQEFLRISYLDYFVQKRLFLGQDSTMASNLLLWNFFRHPARSAWPSSEALILDTFSSYIPQNWFLHLVAPLSLPSLAEPSAHVHRGSQEYTAEPAPTASSYSDLCTSRDHRLHRKTRWHQSRESSESIGDHEECFLATPQFTVLFLGLCRRTSQAK